MKVGRLLSSFSALMLTSVGASADLNIRVSVKFILNAAGKPPTNYTTAFGTSSVGLTNSQSVSSNIDYANSLLASMGRGYRFQLSEVQNVTGLSSFFNIAARNDANRDALDSTVTANAESRAQYLWRDNAINIYINNSSSGICAFPPGRDLMFIGSDSYNTLIIHEVGHFLDLFHTHQGEDGCTDTGETCGCGETLVGGDNDRVGDTVADHECWSFAQLSANNPSASTQQLNDVWLNIMSYHLPQNRFTSDQLDRWTDTANGVRNPMVSGRTVFVDADALGFFPDGSSDAALEVGGPYQKLENGIGAASNGDIVLIRPGIYDESFRITKAVTLRATRGDATIGR